MNNTYLPAFCVLFICATLLGCSEDIDSDDVRTSGFYGEFQALALGDGTTEVTARLKTGGDNSNTFADLQGDDTLVASAEQDEKTMSRRGSGNRSPYEAEFDTDDGGTLINVALLRGELDVDAPASYGELPEPFLLHFGDMDEGDEVQRGNGFVVEWDSGADGRMHWEVEGDCIWTRDGTTSDDGSFVIDAEDIEVQSLDAGEDCEVTITLERVNEGEIDPALGGGEFHAIQRRSISFISLAHPDELEGMGGSEN